MSVRWMERASAFAPDHCSLCATICKSCQEACEEAGLRECADACRRSFDTCLRMSQAAHVLVQ